MSKKDEILAKARERASAMNLPYAGALTPSEAFALLQEEPSAALIDVRSRAEWDFVGRIPEAVEIEWKTYPGMAPNPVFLQQLAARVPKEAMALFICRSGGRSHETATMATRAGYGACFNVLEGFEGDRDGSAHRNTVGGWCAAGLPWYQN